MTAKTGSRYVTRNAEILSGEPIITETRASVRAIVGLWRMGIMPEEILNHLPHLTLAQVFDALSFYLDHQIEINAYIALISLMQYDLYNLECSAYHPYETLFPRLASESCRDI